VITMSTTSSHFSLGDTLVEEGVIPSHVLYPQNECIAKWLYRHPKTGIIETLQYSNRFSVPIGGLSVLTGHPCEHVILTSRSGSFSHQSADDFLSTASIESKLYPLQSYELIPALGAFLSSLPQLDLPLVTISELLLPHFELYNLPGQDQFLTFSQFLLNLNSYPVVIGDAHVPNTYGRLLNTLTEQEYNKLSDLGSSHHVRLYRLNKQLSSSSTFEVLLNELLRSTPPSPSSEHSSPSGELISLQTFQHSDPDRIAPVTADSVHELPVAFIQLACSFYNITFRQQRLVRTSSILDSYDEEIPIASYLSILSPLTGLSASRIVTTYRNLLIKRQPFIAPLPNSTLSPQYAFWVPSHSLTFTVYNPISASPITCLKLSELHSTNQEVITLEVDPNSSTTTFNFSWFWPEIKRHRLSLIVIFVSSLFIQLLQLANPLLIQQIIDLILGERSLPTLYSFGTILIIFSLFQSLLTGIRGILFVETTNRIDVRVGTKIIDHLLHLPISYFDRRPVGDVSTRIGELENIRSFLTGQALTVVLDVLFGFIYIVVMLFYSVPLTVAALSTIPFTILLAILFSPIIKSNIDDRAVANAKTTSFLVEHLNGILTVKSQNIEDRARNSWRKLYLDFISKGFKLASIGAIVGELNNFLTVLSSVVVIFVGAILVIKGDLSLGQLIAFRIIAGYVTAPIMRLSTLWQSFQELSVSVQRLADVVESNTESDIDSPSFVLPPLKGELELKNLSFKYPESDALVLKRINLTLQPGRFVGVVGTSGSGKSTLMKLIPLIYQPSGGSIFIDNYDVSKVSLDSLRSQIGIVPQDPLLFQGTVWDNLTSSNPNVTATDVQEAVNVAEAYDFIMNLPKGFDTDVGERGGRLSGGQRQRIAIARALLSRPSLLILDEATSALDYRTESAVCRNLFSHLKGKTVLFVTHRLATIKPADTIILMDKGIIAEQGSYTELMHLDGIFAALINSQVKEGLTAQ